MDLQAELRAVLENPARNRRTLLRELLTASLYVRGPQGAPWAVVQPETDQRALPAFLSAEAARRFWVQSGVAHPTVETQPITELARLAAQVGGLVLEPEQGGLLLDRSDLRQLAVGQVPGEFSAWMRDVSRLGSLPADVMAELRRAHVYVITGPDETGAQRLYLLAKSSDDGARAVACFSSPEMLAQFAEVRQLFTGNQRYAVALQSGEETIRTAVEIGASLILDPESAWETTLEPTLIDLGKQH